MVYHQTQKKIVVSMLLISVLLVSGMPIALSVGPKEMARGWYWKPPYPNYAPHTPGGMPDFDQKQDAWKKITAGPNGVLNSVVAGDDILNVALNCIAPGPNAHLDSVVAGDDVAEWCFCGPVAVANCLWWLDSRFEDPNGTPGDGLNEFDLVKNYGAGDDHAKANVPLLIENLARAMQTTSKGTTYVSDMQSALTNWFTTYGLSSMFVEHTVGNATFPCVAENITACQDVILLLSDYTRNLGNLLIDQQMPVVQSSNDNLQPTNWWDYQSFVPSVNRLDAIDVCLVNNNGAHATCDVRVSLYNAPSPAVPIATSTLNPGYFAAATWVRFPFPAVPLTAGSTYYFDVREVPSPDVNYYEWFYVQATGDPYPPGMGWKDGVPGPTWFDWTFKTLYYNPIVEKGAGHFVTCAGVDTQNLKIAFSDPDFNVNTPGVTDHNDAKNVSHDQYNVVIGSPDPGIHCTWYIQGYPVTANYTVVESAVIVCPLHNLNPNLDSQSSLTWTDVHVGGTVTGNFTIKNIGDPTSRLDWKVADYPHDWGNWTFTPLRGDNLKPEDGSKTIQVSVVAPTQKYQTFTGNVKVVNEENGSDYVLIPISLKTPVNQGVSHPFWDWLLVHFPWLGHLFRCYE